MMNKVKFILSLLVLQLFSNSCNQVNQETKNPNQSNYADSSDEQMLPETIVDVTTDGPDYFFEPQISVLIGTLKTELNYGPPNYGENPETDEKHNTFIFFPIEPINIIQQKTTSAEIGFNVTKDSVIKFQLAPMENIELHPFINKKIKVTGTFYGAHTGHHYTDVLLAVTSAELF